MIPFDPAHRAVHYPPDRRFRLWIRPSILIGIGIAILSAIAASWIEVAVAGLPHVPAVASDLSQQLRGTARISGVGALLPLFQFSFCDDADSQRSVHPGGSSSSVFQ